KPDLQERAYSCVVVFDPKIFSAISFTGKFSLVDVYLALAKKNLILGYDHTGDRLVDVGKTESVAKAESLFI
ncbi:MAG: nucleotidyltransferase family protein, partial [Bacteroidetes bacterium]|nr:nucleotidyltransferase family protein [Bacteroidota bacterium]